MIFLSLASLILIVLAFYISENRLRLIRPIFYILICFYNVLSLYFMVQYFKDLDYKIYHKALYPFVIDDKIDLIYPIWIFALTLILILIQGKTSQTSGVDDDRQ